MKKNPSLKSYLTKKGIALILTIGIIALLSMIGTVFAISSLLEIKQVYNYNHSVKARYLAEAGINRAIAELKYGAQGAKADGVDTTLETWYTTGYSDSSLMGGLGQYGVSIVDCASQINLNDNNPNLTQILYNLNAILGSPLASSDCDNIVNNRPYLTRQMVKTALGDDQAKYNAIEPYITIYGFIDPYVVNAQDISTPFAFQPRGPINVNTASQAVLAAMLQGLVATHACPVCGGDGELNGVWWKGAGNDTSCWACDKLGNLFLDSTEAPNLAAYIVANRPYSTWSQFYLSLRNCPSIGPRDADLVLANANPNTGFSWVRNEGWGSKLGYVGKYIIDKNKNGAVDTDDKGLTDNTTEFSFNSGGYYEITSTGTFRDASKRMTVVAKIYDIFRQRTQAQFESSGSSKTNVQTYPEPTAAGVAASACSGDIMLDRVTHAIPNAGAYFRADYLGTTNPDAGGGSLTTMTGSVVNNGSVVNFSSIRGDLMPDGLLVDMFNGDALAYYYPAGNVSEIQGAVEIWFKPQWNYNDTVILGDSDQDKKIFRVTSGTPINDPFIPNGYPFTTCFFWSDNTALYFGGRDGGGYYTSDPNYPDGMAWYGPNWFAFYYGIDWFYSGQWNQLVLTWTPPPPSDPLDWGKITVYMNGVYKWWGSQFIHTPYSSMDDLSYAMSAGFEKGSWNANSWEISDSVIGSVRIWDQPLTDAQVQAEYQNGIYENSGTFVSSRFDPGNTVDWGTITWTAAIPDNVTNPDGSITKQICNGSLVFDVDTTGSGASFGGGWGDPGNGRPISGSSNAIRYRAAFSSTLAPAIETPVLEDVTITYLPATTALYCR